MSFIPVSHDEALKLGWNELDIILISGDAYVDHPSFGITIIGKYLIHNGYRVGIIPQPDWKNPDSITVFGKPRLFFGVSSGNMDSMVNHYTAQKKLRHNDAYSPNGKIGLRPDRAIIQYCNLIKQKYKGVPIIIGGIEASMRRISHYDFWSDKVRNSILSDSKADLLVYGMGEKAVIEIADSIAKGIETERLDNIRGTVVFANPKPDHDYLIIPDSELCKEQDTFHIMTHQFNDNYIHRIVYQKCAGRYIKHNPPAHPLTETELDEIYGLQFEYKPHPMYKGMVITAYNQIKDSITSHRGCFGGCNFCAIGFHQTRNIQSRSQASIIKEASIMSKKDDFKGTITDVGGPTANMYNAKCKLKFPDTCNRTSCLMPTLCPNLILDSETQILLLRSILGLKGIKNVFISSGIRHDIALTDLKYIQELITNHISGRLKLAPEHISKKVLRLMNKPPIESYQEFCNIFNSVCKTNTKRYQIIPYIIIGHPGTTIDDAIELGLWLKKRNIRLEQVQEFTPTPMTISTCMYFTGKDYYTGENIFIPKGRMIHLQKALIFWYDRKYCHLIKEALSLAKRLDLLNQFIS